MFYEYINEYQIKKAPYPLRIDDYDVFTNDEKIYNEQGYYALERDEYPQDGKSYQPYYELYVVEGKIHQSWEEIETEPQSEDKQQEFAKSLSVATSLKDVRQSAEILLEEES